MIRDLSLPLAAGEVLGLLGPNGAGKTSLFRVLTGMLPPSAGEIRFDGRPVSHDDPVLRYATGVVFQEPALDPRLSARRNLLLSAALYRVPRGAARLRVARLLERARLGDRAEEPLRRLSGGMRRRVELARALVHEPSLLILDEPTTGLDERAFRRFWSDLKELRGEREVTLLLTTHRGDEAEYCDRLAILDEGRLVACDTPDRLRRAVRGDLVVISTRKAAAVGAVLAERFGLEPQTVDGKLVFRQEAAHEWIPRIVEALPSGSLDAIEMRRTGLAEVFLELTGRELDGARP